MGREQPLYHPNKVDEYVNHLALFGHRHVLMASEDIYNNLGALLLKKGTRINTHTAALLHKHHLNKPLDDLIRISERLTNAALLDATRTMLNRYPDLKQIHESHDFEGRLIQLYKFRALPLPVQQKLTVMSENLPESFERSLFCAWLAPLIATKMELSPAEVYNAFLVGLLHDLGLVHLPLETVTKTRNYEPKEWQLMCCHVVVGGLILKQQGFEKPVLLAVQNHHEYCDGKGYPARRIKTQLEPLSQIIALCDLLYGMRARQFEPAGKNLADALPFLLINNQTFFSDTHAAIVDTLKSCGLNPTGADVNESYQKIPQQLLHGGRQLTTLLKLLHSLLSLPDRSGAVVLESLHQQAYASIHASGLGSEELEGWLNALTAEEAKEAALELQELKGFLDGAHWIFKRACRLLPLLASTARSDADAQRLLEVYKQIELARSQWESNWG